VGLSKLAFGVLLDFLSLGLNGLGLGLFSLLWLFNRLFIIPIIISDFDCPISKGSLWLLLLWWSLIISILNFKALLNTGFLSGSIGQKSLAA